MKQLQYIIRQKKIVNKLREYDPEMGMQTFLALLCIAESPGMGTTELARAMNTTGASASRNVSLLSGWKKKGVKGMGLVDNRWDEVHRHRKILTLTPRGAKLITELSEII